MSSTSPPPAVRSQIFDRLTKGDSYFLHQVRKNRRKQYTRRRNHSPFDALDAGQGGAAGLADSGSQQQSTSYSEHHSSDSTQNPHHSRLHASTHHGSTSSSKSPRQSSGLDSYLDQLREQHSTKEQWKKNMEQQREKMEDWNEQLRSRIAQVDNLKQEIKENQQKHEEMLKAERKRLETEFNAKKLRMQKKEVALYKLMEDVKQRSDRNSQREKYMDLREQETRQQIHKFHTEKAAYDDEIERLKALVKRQEHQIMLLEKKLQIAEQDKIQYEKDRKELEISRNRVVSLEESLRRATVERERYATEKETELMQREKQMEEREHTLQENETRCEQILQREEKLAQREHDSRETQIKLEKKTVELEQQALEVEKKRHEATKEDHDRTTKEFEVQKTTLEKQYHEKLEHQEELLSTIRKELEEIKQQKDEAVQELQQSQQVKTTYIDRLNQITASQNPQALVKTSSSQLEKRITFISNASESLTTQQMDDIVNKSIEYNRSQGITSILVCVKNIFIHIIEGETEEIDTLFGKIYKDERHDHIQVVNIEENIPERKFAESYFNRIEVQDPTATAFLSMLTKLKRDQEIIENYMQPPVLGMIKTKINPLKIPCARKNRVVMQCEMFRFNDLVELTPPDRLKEMINQYFNLCSRLIHRNGGQVVSFREDTIIAYFEMHAAVQAVTAGVEIVRRLQKYRERDQNPLNRLKTTFVGIGITKGATIEGTLGGPVMKQYTIIGPTVKRARLLQYHSRCSTNFVHFDEKIKMDLEQDSDFVPLLLEAGQVETISCPAYSIRRTAVQYSQSTMDTLSQHLEKLERLRRSEQTLQQNGIFVQRIDDEDNVVRTEDTDAPFSVFDKDTPSTPGTPGVSPGNSFSETPATQSSMRQAASPVNVSARKGSLLNKVFSSGNTPNSKRR
mmetsp:Transcript_2622/g.10024  ORF Transcript_2622/g.10024 Transcript_2622/m.10024 type:complete len:911 (-) Transcript_2622:320-3052(-)|eukprot:CAMPEP_0117445562 /NCGR_PEP_ID=MMETSP0759-20121206/5863_1 /TAXON_ID=63605 /ORGANISM="Percolomonas cosmopolitus, Strain WS" /LENGTH=910 /DNA_ID=CAMNT_0005237749 /DNA_START=319 /DNA_END=3051 /DNA_ORIENTATION=+